MSAPGAGNPDLAALAVLRARMGTGPALGLGLRLSWERLKGAPFKALPPAEGPDEKKSRAQIGPAIILYRLLLARGMAQAEAFALVREVVLAAGVAFMGQTLGSLTRAELEALDEAGRRAFVESRGQRFFNAELRWDHVGTHEVRFTALSCRFPALCEAVGALELAPLFCEVDEAFFGAVEEGVSLERPHTIAGGAETCPFRLKWTDP
jgi:hypothetical protein